MTSIWNRFNHSPFPHLSDFSAVALLSSIPLYADAVQNRLLRGELTDAGAYRPPFAFLWHGEIDLERYGPSTNT
jgi:hypothetical protein